MITAWRLAHEDALRKNPDPFQPPPKENRWSTTASIVAYGSANVALAAMELLAHWGRYGRLDGYHLYSLRFSETDVEDALERGPELDIEDRAQTRRYGDAWASEQRSVVLRVRSVVVPFSDNYVINPRHPDAPRVLGTVESHGAFVYDKRIVELVQIASGRA